jgi:hypothetical protein
MNPLELFSKEFGDFFCWFFYLEVSGALGSLGPPLKEAMLRRAQVYFL